MAAKSTAYSIEANLENMTLTVTLGETVETIAVADLDEKTQSIAVLHGLKQKIADAAALPKGSSDAEKQGAMAKVIDQLRSGAWNAIRATAQKGWSLLDLQTEAMARFLAAKGDARDKDAIKGKLKAMSQAQRAAYMSTEQVSPYWAEVSAEHAKAAASVEEF